MFKIFKGKAKKNQEQLAIERQNRFREVMARLEYQEQENENKKRDLVNKIKIAQANGLSTQEKEGRKLLATRIVMGKRIKGMKLNLEYSLETRDLASLTKDFLSCLKEISKDIRSEVAKTDENAGKEYEKAVYELDKQSQILDDVLQTSEVGVNDRDEEGVYSKEINEEIDSLLNNEQDVLGSKDKIRNF